MSTFNTTKLKQLVGYAIKGSSFDKLIDLTNDIGIKVKSNRLTLSTTDGKNYLKVSTYFEDIDDMNITVNAELFASIINKTTTEAVDLDIVNNTLVVNGNGKYTLGLEPDENGDLLTFPDKFPTEREFIGKIIKADLIIIDHNIKASLSSVEGSVYSGYYFGDVIASTDRAMIGLLNRKVFEEPFIFSRRFVDLLCMCESDVSISKSNDSIIANSVFTDFEVDVYTKPQNEASEFNLVGVNKMLNLEINSFCRVRKAELLNLLDRMALFVSKFDDGAINIEFTDYCMNISSMSSSGDEAIEYTESKNVEPFKIKIDINRLIPQLKAYASDIVDLYFGNDMCIKLVDGDITQMIALMR